MQPYYKIITYIGYYNSYYDPTIDTIPYGRVYYRKGILSMIQLITNCIILSITNCIILPIISLSYLHLLQGICWNISFTLIVMTHLDSNNILSNVLFGFCKHSAELLLIQTSHDFALGLHKSLETD